MSRLLILVPTVLELKAIHALPGDLRQVVSGAHLCGFGPIEAAARTAQLLAVHRPSQVLLLGIAGSLAGRLTPGSAAVFSEVICFGIGAGTGSQFISADEMGWSQSPIALHTGQTKAETDVLASALLTSCAASGTDHDARDRAERFPQAAAEDMEGYGVALSCQMAGIPLTVIRGISNEAGNRNLSQWRISDALRSALELARVLCVDIQQNMLQ